MVGWYQAASPWAECRVNGTHFCLRPQLLSDEESSGAAAPYRGGVWWVVFVRSVVAVHLLTADLPLHLPAGEEAAFQMHLGAYGQAYFAAETMEVVSGEQEAFLIFFPTSC